MDINYNYMKTPHKVNYYYALSLIFIGFLGFVTRYTSNGDMQFTSLIPAFFGFIFLFFTQGIRNDNALIAHLAVILTLILAGVVTFMFVKNMSGDFSESFKFFIFLVTGLVSYVVLAIYIAGFIDTKRNS